MTSKSKRSSKKNNVKNKKEGSKLNENINKSKKTKEKVIQEQGEILKEDNILQETEVMKEVEDKKKNNRSKTKKEQKEISNNTTKNSLEKESKINKKENEIAEQKEILKSEEKKDEKENPEIDKKREENIKVKKENKKYYIVILIFILLIVIGIFSTIFAFLNRNNLNMAKGVKIKNIDVSNLSIEDAKKKIEQFIEIELMQDLTMQYEDKFEMNLKSSEIEIVYDIEKSIQEAYKVGRSGNIIIDNYTLLYAAFMEKNIDIAYTYNKENLDKIIDNIEVQLPGVVKQFTYYIEDDELIINKGIDGIGIDKEVFIKNILENIKKRNAETIKNNNEVQKVEIPIISKKAAPIDVEKIYEEIYTEPKDAYYELEPFNIYPEVNGVDLEISLEEAKKQIELEEKSEYKFDLKITPAEKTIKSFGIEAFPEKISSFTTKYDASNINRSKNLEIAAGKINGLVLLPGEVFSFNKVVGKRTVEEGYRDAKIYQDGGVVDGLAGGICQISSTLYNAVLLANLEIVERRNHSFVTSYVPAGRDATVVYGTTDFQFKNSRTYPIKIESSVSGGVAMFTIHSVSLEENEYEIKIKPVITQSIPYTTEYVPDPTLMPGQQIIKQSGQPGYRVTTYKECIQNGITISNEAISSDLYRPMRTIIKTGP